MSDNYAEKNIENIERRVLNCFKMVCDKELTLQDDLREVGINSLIYIKFTVESETEFGIIFENEELVMENYHTVQECVDLIKSKLAMKG